MNRTETILTFSTKGFTYDHMYFCNMFLVSQLLEIIFTSIGYYCV